MKQFFVTVAAVFVGLLLFMALPLIMFTGWLTSAVLQGGSDGPRGPVVIELDLRQGVTDQDPQNPFALFGESGVSVMRIVETLDRAEDDDRVRGLFVRLPEGGITPAAADEIRQAIRRFRRTGKPVIAHSQGMLPAGAVVSSYMIGASASEFWLQGNASLQAAGLATEEIFFGRAFERYGINAQFEQRYEYKNAPNPFLQSDYTAPHREATLSWMNSVYINAVANAARDREMERADLQAALEEGPATGQVAVERGLVDRLGQVEEAERHALTRAGENAHIVSFGDYASRPAQPGRGAVIAVIGGEGAIVTGPAQSSPFGGDSTIFSDDLAEAIYDAIEDDSVRAIVLRVSSPGGSDVASEQILAAVRAAIAADKPVVVSMGAYAASGGYWISSEASHIVAQPSTLTGSIGVFGGKFVLAEALGRFGIDVRGLSVGGDYADAFATGEAFSAEDRAAFAGWMDSVYNEFIERVARGRDLPEARVREIARGRVWTGAQARQLGLVDELGGFHEAVNRARVLAEIGEDDDIQLRRFPAQRSPWEELARAFSGGTEAAEALITLGAVARDPEVRAIAARVRAERARSEGSVVLADEPLN
ncbi:signal peptide peptidase SppA [Brevundimonas sp.]|uniref:signal peptide peptidase SppA n=1 Tax=Brevundimonas sp. TaxID=1871086 RepID=UPI0025D9BFC0|nr:signal peptide peptidase SppA [Brevundimonas sp.]